MSMLEKLKETRILFKVIQRRRMLQLDTFYATKGLLKLSLKAEQIGITHVSRRQRKPYISQVILEFQCNTYDELSFG